MKGFSLIELVSVIAIIGVLGITVITMTPSLDGTQLNVAAHQVLSDIHHAKQNATTTGQTSGVNFVSGGIYTAYQGSTATPLLSPLTRQDMIVLLSDSYSSVSISNNFVVEFDSLGAPSSGGGGSVTLTNGTDTRTITITVNTGKVTLQ